jgi:hypothetical protein
VSDLEADVPSAEKALTNPVPARRARPEQDQHIDVGMRKELPRP